ncbi:MAG: hypothetical protein Q7U47_12640 [Paludibacter sp.]|nr:hypothetical protein [Paludibacter sp.]
MKMNSIIVELGILGYEGTLFSIGNKKEAHFCIIKRGIIFRRWYVFHYEKAKMENVFVFNNEDEACRFFIEKLVGSKMYCLQ